MDPIVEDEVKPSTLARSGFTETPGVFQLKKEARIQKGTVWAKVAGVKDVERFVPGKNLVPAIFKAMRHKVPIGQESPEWARRIGILGGFTKFLRLTDFKSRSNKSTNNEE